MGECCSRSSDDFLYGQPRCCLFGTNLKDLTTASLQKDVDSLRWLTTCQSTHRDPNGDEIARSAREELLPLEAELARRRGV